MDTTAVLRAGYLGAAASILLIALIPALSSRFLSYGPRSSPPTVKEKDNGKTKDRTVPEKSGLLPTLLDRLASLTIPHSWFTSFYVVSVACSLLWHTQLLSNGPLFRPIAARTAPRSPETSMTWRQVVLIWLLLFLQGCRRLYESIEFARPSQSRMWVGHLVVGMAFYVATSIAIWVEGISAIQTHTFTPFRASNFAISGPNLYTFIGMLLFILASGIQLDVHAYLASLKSSPPASSGAKNRTNKASQYTLPTHPAFSAVLCPHYTAECLIYLGLALIATPPGLWMNWTMFCALVFVVANLGVTAHGTRDWYARTFGEEAVRGKWRMIPFVF